MLRNRLHRLYCVALLQAFLSRLLLMLGSFVIMCLLLF